MSRICDPAMVIAAAYLAFLTHAAVVYSASAAGTCSEAGPLRRPDSLRIRSPLRRLVLFGSPSVCEIAIIQDFPTVFL